MKYNDDIQTYDAHFKYTKGYNFVSVLKLFFVSEQQQPLFQLPTQQAVNHIACVQSMKDPQSAHITVI